MESLTKQCYEEFIKKIYSLLYKQEINDISVDLLKQIEEKIRSIQNENENLNIAIDYSVDNIHLADGQGTILRVNSEFQKRIGSSRENIEGRNVQDLEEEGSYRPSVAKLALQEKRKLTMIQDGYGGKVITTSTPVFDENGDVFRVVSNVRPIDELTLLNNYFYDKNQDKNKESFKKVQLIFVSDTMKIMIKQLEHVSRVDSGILFTGESGTGKSALARYVHEKSPRSSARFIEINCAAIPESLIESELFGYDTGAFTGAKNGGKPGLIELAQNGTLFLDEIGDMPFNLQAKLLQVIQKKQITRIGGQSPIDVDIRIISATNQDLEEKIKEGTFRHDLYYRLNVIPVYIPPIRERQDDIVPLVEFFINKYNEKYKKNIAFSKQVMDRLLRYEWPGNVREIENLIERLIVTDQNGLVMLEHLPSMILTKTEKKLEPIVVNKIMPLREALDEVEKQLIINAYEAFNSSYKVAKSLEISQSAAFRRIKKYVK